LRRVLFAALAVAAACTPAADGGNAQAPGRAAVSSTLERPAYVVDSAGMLLAADEHRIAERLRGFERRTGHQFILVTVRTTNGRGIADYTRDLGNRWGIGRRGHDDGVILLFAMDDRRVRIAVGDGLRQALPDETAAQIIRMEILPGMSAHAPDAGVKAGVEAILARLQP
jgi:uncharacterized protein